MRSHDHYETRTDLLVPGEEDLDIHVVEAIYKSAAKIVW